MTEQKHYTAYDIAVEALTRAEAIVEFGGIDEHLENAEKIRLWLFEKGELAQDPAPSTLTYFADEARDSDGSFPEYTYWYRHDSNGNGVRRVDGERDVDYPRWLQGITLDQFKANHRHMFVVPVNEVPEWAR